MQATAGGYPSENPDDTPATSQAPPPSDENAAPAAGESEDSDAPAAPSGEGGPAAAQDNGPEEDDAD